MGIENQSEFCSIVDRVLAADTSALAAKRIEPRGYSLVEIFGLRFIDAADSGVETFDKFQIGNIAFKGVEIKVSGKRLLLYASAEEDTICRSIHLPGRTSGAQGASVRSVLTEEQELNAIEVIRSPHLNTGLIEDLTTLTPEEDEIVGLILTGQMSKMYTSRKVS